MYYNHEVESSILGTMLMSESCLLNGLSWMKPVDFDREIHSKIFCAIQEMTNKKMKIDSMTLVDYMQDVNLNSLISKMISDSIGSGGFKEYVQIARTHSFRRAVERVGNVIKDLPAEYTDTEELSLNVEKMVFEALQRPEVTNYKSMKKATESYTEKIDQLVSGYKGISSGYKSLDDIIGWFEHGQYNTLAAGTSMGKSMFAGEMAYRMAKNNIPVAIFSLEMMDRQYISRWISKITKIPHEKVSKDPLKINFYDGEKLKEATEEINKLPIFIDDTANIDLMKLVSKIRLMKRRHDIQVVFVDHIGLIRYQSNYKNRNLEIGYITSTLKGLAKEFNIVIIGLCQINRGVSDRADKRPCLSDLRDSGTIEENSDMVMFLYRDEYYNKNTDKPGILELWVAKNRDGRTGGTDLVFMKDICAIGE
ncbi:MAG: hypothetical protein HGB12_03030 [Bacteroidetes bacterium]|nr:hypothetical protein [Bacteroidota bacterium]